MRFINCHADEQKGSIANPTPTTTKPNTGTTTEVNKAKRRKVPK